MPGIFGDGETKHDALLKKGECPSCGSKVISPGVQTAGQAYGNQICIEYNIDPATRYKIYVCTGCKEVYYVAS